MTSTNANALPYNPLLERAHHVEELWRIVIPFCPPPGLRQIIRWQSRFSDDLIRRAFGAVSAKFEKGPAPESMEQVDQVYRYTTGTLCGMQRIEKAKEDARRRPCCPTPVEHAVIFRK